MRLPPCPRALLLLFAVLLCLAPSFCSDFATADDWFHLANARGRVALFEDSDARFALRNPGEPWLIASVAGGRPVQALLAAGAFAAAALAPGLAGVAVLRLLGALGAAVLGLLLHRALRRANFEPGAAACLALLMATSPPFQVYASWGVMWSVPWAAALTGVAYGLLQRGRRGDWLRAGLALLVVGGVYQVSLMFFLVFLAIDLLGPTETRPAARRALGALALLFGVLVVGFVLFKLGSARYGRWLGAARTQLNRDILGKLAYVARLPLRDALQLGVIQPLPLLPFAVAALIGVGLVRRLRAQPWRLGLSLLLLPGVYLPNLLTAENWGAFRTQMGLAALLLLWFGVALQGLLGRASRVVLSLLVVLALGNAARNVWEGYAAPLSAEVRALRGQLAALDLQRVQVLHLRRAVAWARLGRYDEYGLPATYPEWTGAHVIQVLARERLGEAPRFTVEIHESAAPLDAARLPPGHALIDMPRLLADLTSTRRP